MTSPAAQPDASAWHGLLVVDKPLGWSSMDAIRHIRRAAGLRKLKVGHAGTLDPLATGVLVCCVGPATKLIDRVMGQSKTYETVIDLSAYTTTDDREGDHQEVNVDHPPSPDAIAAALARLTGEIEQTPPAYSAVHVDGKRAYDLARQGREVKIAARRVVVHAIEVLGYAWPMLSLRIDCGKGVYIRSMARDIGGLLGTGGHLASLRRTRVGQFDLSLAITGEALTAGPLTPDQLLSPAEVGLLPAT